MMKTKIKKLSIVCAQRAKTYEIGEVYNDLILYRIEDRSQEFPDATEFYYQGFTITNGLVFEVINAPIEVEYMKEYH